MTEEKKYYKVIQLMHPRVKEVLEAFAPPSPMVMPRDLSQPRVGFLSSIHDHYLPIEPLESKPKIIKPQVALKLESCLLKRRKKA